MSPFASKTYFGVASVAYLCSLATGDGELTDISVALNWDPTEIFYLGKLLVVGMALSTFRLERIYFLDSLFIMANRCY